MSLQSINPTTGEIIETFEETSPHELFATRGQMTRSAARLLKRKPSASS